MKNHILQNRFSTNFKFAIIGILFLLSCTKPSFAQNTETPGTYKTYIKQADQAFAARDYARALKLYEKAHEVEPEYNYAADKIDITKKLLEGGSDPKVSSHTPSKNSNNSYKTIIAQADYALAIEDYGGALLLYEKAYQTEPDYNYATTKIEEINSKLDASPDSKNALFQKTILKADSLNEQKKYQQAKAEYQKATLIDPTAQLPKDKLLELSASYIDPEDMANFNLALSSGDRELAINDFDHAIMFYEAALKLHPNVKFVNRKITDAKKLQVEYIAKAGQKTTNKASADKLPSEKTNSASNKNQVAIAVAAADLNTKENNKEAKDINANSKKTPADTYDKSIELADQFYKNREFNDASLKYQEAINTRPDATYPKEMLVKIKNDLAQQLTQQKYDAALASAEIELKSADYEYALAGFKSASDIKPSETYPKTKIAEIEKLLSLNIFHKNAYDIAIKNGDQSLNEKKYDAALTEYRTALALFPEEKYPSQKIEEITSLTAKQKEVNENYSKSVAEADIQFNGNRFEEAILSYNKALGFKPAETYPQQKIKDAQGLIALSKNKDENYASAISNGDRLFSSLKYTDALSAYKQALTIKPNETYPLSKTTEINSILLKQSTDAENYAQALRTGEKALAAGNFSLALTSFQDANKIKPQELYPLEQITEIKAETANQQKKNDKYAMAVKTGDQLFSSKDYNGAKTAYAEAVGIKKNEKYPQDQIVKIDEILLGSQSVDNNYTLAITEGDKLFGMKDYSGANASFAKASAIKPAESYPKQRMIEIKNITEGIALTRSAEYNKAIENADKLFNSKVYDQAIDAYETAASMNPGDAYPELQISKIRKYMSDHSILNLYSQKVIIGRGNEKKFPFSAIEPSLRKNNYILLKARSTGRTVPKVYLNYGKDETKNGGIVLRNFDKSSLSDYLISISIQDKWFREENNWISISVETGEIEIMEVQIAAGE